MLLFLLAAGLSLIYGLMRMLNLAHGSYYILGGYVGLATIKVTGSFVLAALAATFVVTLIGVVMERFFLRRFLEQELPQALLTFGFLLIFADLSLWIGGGPPQPLARPETSARSIRMGTIVFPSYRLFVIGVGLVIGLGLWWLQEGTRLGAMIRAGVDDAEMARGTGVNVGLLSTAVFALGAFLAALGGIIGGPFVGGYPGADFEILEMALVVVIIGGLRSLKGAFVGGVVGGLLHNFGKALFPALGPFTGVAPMAIILAIRPTGLFGVR